MALIKRDPFARTELHRQNEYSETRTCAFCGGQRTNPGGKKYLYRFYIASDSGHEVYDGKMFCSKSCRDAYRA